MIPMAKDQRLRAGVMVYGGADFSKLLDSYANQDVFAVQCRSHFGVAPFYLLFQPRHWSIELAAAWARQSLSAAQRVKKTGPAIVNNQSQTHI